MRAGRGHRAVERRGVEQVALEQRHGVAHAGEVRQRAHRRRPHESGHVVSAGDEQLGEIRAVLPGDPRDERAAPSGHPVAAYARRRAPEREGARRVGGPVPSLRPMTSPAGIAPTAMGLPAPPPTADVLGVALSLTDYERTLDWMDTTIAASGRAYV